MYEHRQTSFGPSAAMVLIFLPVAVLLVLADGPFAPKIGPLAVMGLVVLLRLALASMDTTVDETRVRARYRPFGPARVIELDAVISHDWTRVPWYYALGGFQRIHGRGGWGFAVWGTEAVEIRHHDDRRGEKTFFVGTDDAEGLAMAIHRARTESR